MTKIAIFRTTLARSCDDGPCQTPTKHYTEIGCKPIHEEGGSCPTRFKQDSFTLEDFTTFNHFSLRYECPSFADRDHRKCYFNGNIYEPESSLSKFDERLSPCYAGCICINHNNLSFFICAAISCPEVMTRGADCIFQYSPFECCPTEKVCGDQTKKLSECYLEGTRYLEGEMMYPREESCYKCSCQRGFDNSTIRRNPNCYELTCGIELFNLEPLLDGCSPVFFGTRGCCPISWRCPNDKDTVIREDQPVDANGINPKLQCKFGNLTLNVGDYVSSDQTCVSFEIAFNEL
ncbi:conserved hypothetical protein [Culex quinquefasciatus]|uniref:VWFC domain-containing protein n=1 Tax=Culex quinquefasciatus TaxID=7176 RepID=B0X386_CULQU|nr:conserved hypothetical protein [Culex quinquefasciatus]|eukprot:XP_001864108.1 conserved hypothetical protein [Culex quinquefasciatus]